MIALAPFLLLLITILTILVIRLTNPRFSYFWLLASGGALLTWLSVLITQLWIPIEWTVTTWQPEDIFRASPALLLDDISWPFSLALITLMTAAILTDVVHPVSTEQPRSNLYDIAGWLAISAAGFLAIVAGNLVTLLLAWSAMDLLEITIRISKAEENAQAGRIVKEFSIRIFSLLLLMGTGILVNIVAQSSSWDGISPLAAQLIFLAVMIRAGIIPFRSPALNSPSFPRTGQTLFNLVPAFASLAVLPRLALFGYSKLGLSSSMTSTFFMAWLGISALYCGLSWATAKNEMEGQLFWIKGVAVLCMASALCGQFVASTIWGVALPLSGGLLFIFSQRREWLLPLPLLGAIFCTALPLTPTWQGAVLYTTPFYLFTVFLMVGHGLLLGGFIRHALRPSTAPVSSERWVWIFLLLGMLVLPFIQYAIAWWSITSQPDASFSSLPWSDWWPGFIILIISGTYVFLNLRGFTIPSRLLAFLRFILSFEWLDRFFNRIIETLMAIFSRIDLILEGQAGILWALLLLTLLLSFVSQLLKGS